MVLKILGGNYRFSPLVTSLLISLEEKLQRCDPSSAP